MSVCYVTAYLEIGRKDWCSFSRTFENYFENFQRFLKIFEKESDNNILYIFIDKKYFDTVNETTKNIPNIYTICIDEEYMNKNSILWSRLKREEEIMNNENYINITKHRQHCPETNKPKYTLINHAKIDFINIAAQSCLLDLYCWVDFGYCGNDSITPEKLLDVNKLDKSKINYTLINQFNITDLDIDYTLIFAPEKIGGFFFYGDRESMKEYQKLYHKIHEELQNIGVVDDDQHLAQRCYFTNPSLFHLHYLGGWHLALKHFQKI